MAFLWLVSKLAFIQIGIETLFFQKFTMGSLFHNVSIPHHKNQVRFLNRREPMSNNKACSAFHHGIKCLLNLNLCPGVDRRGCFIQEEHGGQAEHHPGNTK